jgi:hypothetical protein
MYCLQQIIKKVILRLRLKKVQKLREEQDITVPFKEVTTFYSTRELKADKVLKKELDATMADLMCKLKCTEEMALTLYGIESKIDRGNATRLAGRKRKKHYIDELENAQKEEVGASSRRTCCFNI